MPTAADFGLNDDELDLLRAGLREWGGSARLPHTVARAMRFESEADFTVQRRRTERSLSQGEPMSFSDWRRVLLATEVVFASDVVGSGLRAGPTRSQSGEWSSATSGWLVSLLSQSSS